MRLGVGGLLLEADDAPLLVDLDDAELPGGRRAVVGQGGDGAAGVVLAMEVHHLADVHLVDVVAAEDRRRPAASRPGRC